VDGNLMLVDCSGLEMYEFPAFPDNQVSNPFLIYIMSHSNRDSLQIHMLDLSNNYFTQVPTQLESFIFLQYLDLSENRIQKLKAYSLKGLITLGMLNLSKNNITNWSAINPRTLLEPAVSLRELSLAGNPLTSFTTNDENLLLVSNTLQLLDLSNCKISKVSGQQILQGMKELKHLMLAGNLIRSISDMTSDTLLTLDLSNNRLTNLLPTMLSGMPSLTSLNLAKNHRISLESKQGEFVTSESLRKIDLSYCNMDSVELEGFPALTTAVLKGNMIRQLTGDCFTNNQVLENLDLSQNSINSIDAGTFRKLKHLKTINLSFNMIPKIDRDTFKENELLTKLDLSRNYIARFNRLIAPQLVFLNMTWCEIMIIDHDAFSGFQDLTTIDLSNNLISDFPDTLASDTLLTLDLSMNRMTAIKNFTFTGFPEITKINLSGNRFTIPFRIEFFESNPFLSELPLGDNPWMCKCEDMYPFYNFLTQPPSKLWEKQTLKCQSPESVTGRTWESACYFTWYPQSRMGTAEKVWTFFMVAVIGEIY
jgi:insulin-like growth factor-binding protein complex acid labile subunit